ncbi:hypothetical protein PHSY_003696 [Pseudozyma hubeiensis SY62]|uniref:Uncharacterized protein n=1 Tax=Pseudozyma hubeiensis (strain SY62) TaxID=1305764 RepID=R9P424_PSEHS|nr:hypothetical protein PHSY_003696 [Pseudozyma hubeiensis SY62]GAC96116.1 hypothetical protein PHSY_003696 [Pseudozyma hubeiensis SY62]
MQYSRSQGDGGGKVRCCCKSSVLSLELRCERSVVRMLCCAVLASLVRSCTVRGHSADLLQKANSSSSLFYRLSQTGARPVSSAKSCRPYRVSVCGRHSDTLPDYCASTIICQAAWLAIDTFLS